MAVNNVLFCIYMFRIVKCECHEDEAGRKEPKYRSTVYIRNHLEDSNKVHEHFLQLQKNFIQENRMFLMTYS